MNLPIMIINFKTYRQATGGNALRLAKACERVAKDAKASFRIAVAVQTADIFRVASSVDTGLMDVFAQHIDAVVQGKFTGFLTTEAAKEAGASGTLLNHAEHKLEYETLKAAIERCRENNLKTVVCATDTKEAALAAKLNPDMIAVEPPELIGTLVSVSEANPEVVTSSIAAVRKVKNISVLCGAGVANREDVRKALELGTSGVLVATAVVLAKHPESALRDLASAITSPVQH